MNPHDIAQSAPESPHVRNPLSVMQPGEQVICEVKRHPIGMFGIYVAAGLILIALAVLAFIVAPNAATSSNRSQVLAGASLGFIIVAALLLVFVFIANIVYWGNSWVVTSDSLTQMTQTSLFRKQASQLSLGNLEDVTSERNGILAQIFNFGILKAETAGERSKFIFPFCPNPDYYAQKILAAREQFEQVHHGGKQEPTHTPVPPEAQPGPGPGESGAVPSATVSQPGYPNPPASQASPPPPPYAPPAQFPPPPPGDNAYQPPVPEVPLPGGNERPGDQNDSQQLPRY